MSMDAQLLAGQPDALVARLAGLKLLVFDVDGVLTDGRIVLGDDGYEYKAFHTHDGHGIRLLQNSGVAVGIITGRTSVLVSRRAEELQIGHLMQGRKDKVAALDEMAARVGVDRASVAFVGDDIVDLGAMRRGGVAIAVANATPVTRSHADWVTTGAGGNGAAREICEIVMAAQGNLARAIASATADA